MYLMVLIWKGRMTQKEVSYPLRTEMIERWAFAGFKNSR